MDCWTPPAPSCVSTTRVPDPGPNRPGLQETRWRTLQPELSPSVGRSALESVTELDAGRAGDTDHPFEVRGDAGRVDHGGRAHRFDDGGPRCRQCLRPGDDRLGERYERRAMGHATVVAGVGERGDVCAFTFERAALTEQPGMGTDSIETIVEHRYATRD